MVTDEPQWYVQKGSRVQGPFTAGEVGRFLLLGRVRNTDRVSRDGELWEPVTQVPELVPEELLDLDNERGWSRLLSARADQDERIASRPEEGPSAAPDGSDRRNGAAEALDRLRADWRPAGTRHEGRDLDTESDAGPERGQRRGNAFGAALGGRAALLPWSLLGITLGALGVVVWLNASGAPIG